MAITNITSEIEQGVLAAVAGAITANATVEEGFITSAEAAVQAGLVNLFKNIPAVKGLASMVVGPVETAVESAIEAYVASLFAKYTPAQIVTAVAGIIAKA